MSRVIWVENREDNVLTNAQEVTLSDSGATYGIREVETGVVTVAAGTATTNPSTGRYEYDVTSLDTSKAYEASFKVQREVGGTTYTTVLIPIPSGHPAPRLCRVFGTLVDLTGEPIANNNIEVSVDRDSLPRFAQHYLLSGTEFNTQTDEDGYFEVDLVREALATIHVKESDMRCKFQVPDLSQVNIEDIPGVYGSVEQSENPF